MNCICSCSVSYTHLKYNALVWGVVENNEGTIEGNIGRNPKDRMQMAVLSDPAQGKHAVTPVSYTHLEEHLFACTGMDKAQRHGV